MTDGKVSTAARGSLWIWRTCLLLLAGLIAWQVVSVNMSEHFVRKARTSNEGALDSALQWNDRHPEALVARAGELYRAGEIKLAVPLLYRSVIESPVQSHSLIKQAMLSRDDGDFERADLLAAKADFLMPMAPYVQRDLATYWLSRQRLDLAVDHISRALAGAPDLWEAYFSFLLRVAEDGDARAVLLPITENPPSWWPSFFRMLARDAESVITVQAIVGQRELSPVAPLAADERNHYIARLRKDGLVAQAYLAWVNGLDPGSVESLGYLYDGGFERPVDNNAGFGWVATSPRNSGIRVTTSGAYGMNGARALRLTFSGKRVRFSHVYQHLFLSPGSYRLEGRVRPDKLRGRRGLRWAVYCTAGEGGLLGQSELFTGSGDWSVFGFDIDVPASCQGQLLRLQSWGSRDVDHEIDGTVYFDDLSIEIKR